ncbi:ABC transporter permease [Geodermatophilus sp. YIM 151500]|uniref:ABC transporter permease n=1 Tax=Geodermatophilus sp. YIM 151500 TaxID=2984531 RepID=UPI0021E391DE|nr:ABC transporter permease [Geodermatophilus sp. YIM 151500]MCV2488852.1 ABC transporter permease [Geodermatophilus sp. YIM 151500]
MFATERPARWSVYALSLVVLAVVWQLAAIEAGTLLASFTETMARLAELVSSGELGSALWASGRIFLTGLALSIVLGLPLGLVFARFPLVTAAVETYVYALYAIPVITLVPFILAGLGFDFRAKVLVVVLSAIFPILISAMEGARSVPGRLLDVAHSYGSRERQLWADVVIPYTVPYAITGIKQGIAGALVGTIIAELFLNATGVGDLLIRASTNYDSAGALAVTLVISVIAVSLMGASGAVERRYARWREGLSG